MRHTHPFSMHDHEAEERLQEALNTSRIYIYTYYTDRLLRKELNIFESYADSLVKFPHVYAVAIRDGLKRLTIDLNDIKQYMEQLHLTIDERAAQRTHQTVSHTMRLEQTEKQVHFRKETLNKEVKTRMCMYVFPLKR